MVVYGTTVIPSDQIEVISGGTVAVSAAFERTIGLIGGMDTANGSATDGNVVSVSSPSDAQDKFGDGSELHRAARLAFNNGVAEMWALPVAETSVTGEAAGGTSGTLSNVPAFDPNVNTEHSITATDTGGTDPDVNIVYDDSVSTPSESDTVNVNPVTGEFEFDAAASGSYEFDYTYGDYSQTEMANLVDEEPRIVVALTESESVASDLAGELGSRAQNGFTFMHGMAGAMPEVDPSSYSDGLDDRRLSVLSAARGFTDEARTEEVRTTAAVGGHLASLPLGESATNDGVEGLVGGLRNTSDGDALTTSEAGTLIDAEVMPLIDYPPVTIVKDMTTSTDTRFERVHTMQIVDEVTELSHIVSRQFVGELNTDANRASLRQSHRNFMKEMRDDAPPLLDSFTVSVTENDSNANQVDVELGVDVVNVMDVIDVTITVGDIVQNGGAA